VTDLDGSGGAVRTFEGKVVLSEVHCFTVLGIEDGCLCASSQSEMAKDGEMRHSMVKEREEG